MEYRDNLEDQYPNEYEVIHFDDGHLKIVNEEEIKYTEEEKNEDIKKYYPDHWSSQNYNNLINIFDDLKEILCYHSVMSKIKSTDFIDYMDFVNNTHIYETYDWNVNLQDFVVKKPNKNNATFREFVGHYLIELKDIFDYLNRTYDNYSFGAFETFCDLAYHTSSKLLT